MSYFFQIVVSGIVVGSIYALAALGLVLVYKSSRVANFAHGQIIAAGAFITYFLTVTLAIPIFFSFLASMIITFFLAMSVERIFLRRLIGEPIISVIMVTIGLGSILDGLIYLTPFGSENFSFPTFLPHEPLSFGGVSISWTQLVGVIITFILIGGFSWFFKKSTVGISMRAVSDDQFASMSVGISVPKVFGLAWATAGLSAAAAGCIIGNITGLNFDTLHSFGIVVFPVIILGGLDSILGAVVAGIIMGLIQQFASGYLDGNFGLFGTGDVMPYIILLIILLFKPHGLFGIHEIERV
ncbi:MAG: branched-chain amino acid ABC transporter permease [Desulfobacula sp.]|jgi:branched-chain amino acid transport system permease protein|uniref:branched-chain amino acid ABC transporter permease n=1 Tax=Desulfobacula sp. TaxID=2593537 RepID=UPI001DA308BD|nr:branched-chain amino acid ABC transporter permease [Desulfobacula sp.]MBT3484574.1 branched-chain amino acid ABC transporter permease [Desulfobacula sp.]MBT3803944.1 branched-chain amino acid ABC transporter permease [Desulfobacula sp.]MBT4023559.1 branched-chain amino acid ABC transporter permease [Desulfobacula sp.]MBT4197773.1 branched-chain amino acid ABC transporter permease [Desulfobacula sp.]